MKNQKIGNKGQSAMEYLMTYGWALLIAAVAITVVWQLGIFKLGSASGPGYAGFGEVNLVDFSYSASGVFECILRNDAGGNVTINSVEIKVYGNEYDTPTNISLSAGEPGKCPSINTGFQESKGDRYELFLLIHFTDETTSVNHTSTGKVWGNYE